MGEKMKNKKMTKKSIFMLMMVGLIFAGFPGQSLAQDVVKVRITEGMPMIPVAIPGFHLREASVPDESTKQEIYQVLHDDLKYSRVFHVVPGEYYSYIQAFDPNNIRFKDWASIQVNILISGSVEVSAEDRVVFAVKVYDVISEKFIFGRNFGGKKEFTRLIAHRAADEMMKYFGERPIFNSKVAFVSSRDGNNEIYMMDYDGQRVRRVTSNNDLDVLPTWSADNEKILYTTYRNNNPDLFMFHLYTGKAELIATSRANYAADWCRGGDKIVYTSTRSGNAEIYIKDMKTRKDKQVTFNPTIDTTPCWSPSGDEIAFTSQRSGTPQIYIMNADGTNVRRITHDGDYYDSSAWSPDGTRIAYVARIESRFDIYVYNLKDNTVIKLTEQSGRNENPTWSPDGRHIIFASNRGGSYQLYTIDYDGDHLRQLTFKGENKMPEWQKK
jgi:TolB protein